MTMRIHGDKIEFPDGTEQFTASSGGGGEAQPPVYAQANLGVNNTVSGGTEVFLNMNEEQANSGDFDTSNGNFKLNQEELQILKKDFVWPNELTKYMSVSLLIFSFESWL